tara:strand:- start:1128 stop:1550 length:423 start_codon:yes stop_codon:yes gene_type:complete
MNCRIHLYLLNEHFSVEHADANHDGEESDMNRKFEWEDELNVKNVQGVQEVENGIYVLQGSVTEGESFAYDVPKMRIFEIETAEGKLQVGCSESILDSCELEKNDTEFSIKILIKDYEPMSNPVPGVFIAAQEFPKELVD